MAIIYRFRG